jgi:hypothetical protein
MGYNIEIKGSGETSELISALHRIIDELENEPKKDVSYNSVNEKGYAQLEIDVEISPDFESDEEEDEED